MAKPHPSRSELSDFVLGKLPTEACDEVASHVDICNACQETIRGLDSASDSLVAGLRTAPPPAENDPKYQRAVEKAASLPSQASSPVVSSPTTRPAPVSLDQFTGSLVECGLMSDDEIRAFLNALPADKRPHDSEALSRDLVKAKKLTRFQALNLCQGKAKNLVMGEYLVLDKIGAGGMGQVFKAQHRRMKRIVAIKVLPPSSMKTPDAVQRFQRETQAAARLMHPNIVAAFDAGQSGGLHFLVMEFVDGQDLSALMKKGPLSLDKALDYILQAARGLAFAHGKGIVHRDIKPANLLLDKDGVVRILDMGLARIDEVETPDHQLTNTGAVMGTIDYMAPEQALDTHLADARSDIYSLGCALYRLLTGQSVFAGKTVVEKILAHRERPIPSLHAARPEISPALDNIVARMLAKQATDRYQTMNEAIADLETFRVQGTAGSAATPAPIPNQPAPVSLPQPVPIPQLAPIPMQPQMASPVPMSPQPVPTAAPAANFRIQQTKPPQSKSQSSGRRPVALGLIGLGMLAVIGIAAGIVLKLPTKDGTLVVEVNEPNAEVQVLNDKGEVVITRPAGQGKVTIGVDAGKHRLRVEKDGFKFFAKDIEIESGKETAIKATLAPIERPQPPVVAKVETPPTVTPATPSPSVPPSTPSSQAQLPMPIASPSPGPSPASALTSAEATAVGLDPNVKYVVDPMRQVAVAERQPTQMDVLFVASEKYPDYLSGAQTFIDPPKTANGSLVEAKALKDGPLLLATNWLYEGNPSGGWQDAAYYTKDQLLAQGWREIGKATLRTQHPDTPPAEHAIFVRNFKAGESLRIRNRKYTPPYLFVLAEGAKLPGMPVAAIPTPAPPTAVALPRSGPPLAVAPFTTLQAKSHQIVWGRYLRIPIESTNAFGMRMVLIPPGEFMMGSTPEQLDVALKMTRANAKFIVGQAPQHRVVINKPFLMGATEVTAGQFKRFVDATRYVTLAEKLGSGNSATTEETNPKDDQKNDLRWHAPGYPLTENSAVTQVTGYDAMAFCNWRSQQEKLAPCYRQNDQNGLDLIPGANGYRLPTEAEWEFACRAGTTTQFSFGDDPALLDQYGWYDKNTSENPSHTVGLKLPNPFGLYDIHGNVWERCQDFYDVNWYKQGESIDPKGPPPSNTIVNRGGAWYANYSYCPSAFRFGNPLKNRYYNYGFRVVRTIDTAAQDTAVVTSTTPAAVQPVSTSVQPIAAPAPKPLAFDPAIDRKAAEWVLSIGGRVTVVEEGKTPVEFRADGTLPQGAFGITAIRLGEIRRFNDSDLQRLEGLAKIEYLAIQTGPLNDAGMQHIRGLSTLQTLEVSRTNISDAGIDVLTTLPNLTYLGLSHTKVTDAGMRYVSQLSNLKYLHLENIQISDAGLAQLAGLKQLSTLRLSLTPITDSGLVHLQGLTKIDNLAFESTNIGDAGMKHLTTLTSARALNLIKTQVTDAGIQLLKSLTNLKDLHVNSSQVTEAGFKAIQEAMPWCKVHWSPPEASSQPSPQPQPAAAKVVATVTPIPVLVAPKKVVTGLILLEFPRVKSQDDLSVNRPDFADLQIPVGQIAVAPSLQSLQGTPNRNALIVGWLKIDVPGEYVFDTSKSGTHTLFLDGKQVAPANTGSKKTNQKITLAAGMVPLMVFRSCFGPNQIDVEWQPPGQTTLSPIPPERLVHDPAEVIARQKQMMAAEQQMQAALPPPVRMNTSKYKQGLVVQSYARLPSQPPENKGTGGVDPSEFKTPNAPPTLEVAFSPWTPLIENNYVASGYLLIERPGEYAFYSDGDWGRDAMCVNGEWVSKFGARQGIIARSTLSPGMVPIQIVCYVAGKRLDVQWIPPGQRELSPIPANLLFFNPTERSIPIVTKPAPTPTTVVTRPNDPPGFARPANAPPPAERIAVPLSTDQQTSMELVKEVFKDDYAKLKQPDEKLALAGKLIQQAVRSLDDPTGKYVMLREALRLAIEAGEPNTVEQSASALTSTFELDEFQTLADSWDELLNKTRPTAVNKAVAEQALAKIDRAVEAEEFAKAARLGKIALEAARKSKDNTLVKQVTDREKGLASEKQQWEALTKAAASLAENPDDPAANLLVGRHFCFVAEDWEQGLPMLAKSSDATLKDLAAKSLAATEAAALVELGDAWWSAAEKAKGVTKTELQVGASHFYRLILPALTGLQKTKIEKRLGDIPTAPLGTKKGPMFNLNRNGAKASPKAPSPSTSSSNNISINNPESIIGTAKIAQHFRQLGATLVIKSGDKAEVKIAPSDQLPTEGFTIVELVLYDCKTMTDADLTAIRGLTTLRRIDLDGTRISDAGLASLPGLTSLETLTLGRMPHLTDQATVHLAQLTSLKYLVLSAGITDIGLNQLRTLTNLETLDLKGSPAVIGIAFAQFTGFKNLKYLGLRDTQFGDQGMAHVRRLSTLQTLELGRTKVTDAGMTGLRDLKDLIRLHLYGTATSDVALEYLQQLPNLQRVQVGSQATDAGMAALQKILPKCKVER